MPSFFAYGSLMWDRSLPYVTARTPAVLHGYRRSLCIFSWSYRGTRAAPGLILGLEADGTSACAGCALHVADADERAALECFQPPATHSVVISSKARETPCMLPTLTSALRWSASNHPQPTPL